MHKPTRIALTLIASGTLLIAHTMGQETPAPKTSPAPAKTQSAPAGKKPGTAAAKTQNPATAKPGAAKAPAPPPIVLKTAKDKASYAIGLNIGKSMQRDSVEVNATALLRGIKDALANAKPALSEEEIKAALTELQVELRKKQEEKMEVAGAANMKEGTAFLAENKSKEGVVALPSGLQYKILKEGTGPKPAASDSVVCNYRGTLLNNTEFDSSYKRGQPATFPVNGVIKGWTEALQLMPVGSKWELFVPSELAYGPRGAGQDIGPNSTLIFEVELISIQPKEAEKAPAKEPTEAPAKVEPTNPQ